MKVFKSYYQGIREASLQPKMMFVLWLTNFLFGSVLFYLLYGALSASVGRSVVSENLLKKMDTHFIFEFLIHDAESLRMILYACSILILIYFLASAFLAGGILQTLIQSGQANGTTDKKGFAQLFFRGAGKYFGRFFRLLVYSLALWVAFLILFVLFNMVLHLFMGGAFNERFFFYSLWVRGAAGLFLFFLGRMILDYARIKVALEDSRRVFRSLLRAISFVFQKFGKTLALYYLLLLTGILLAGIFFGLKYALPSQSLIAILLVFLVGQIFIFSRGWLRIAFQKAQLTLYSSRSIETGQNQSAQD